MEITILLNETRSCGSTVSKTLALILSYHISDKSLPDVETITLSALFRDMGQCTVRCSRAAASWVHGWRTMVTEDQSRHNWVLHGFVDILY